MQRLILICALVAILIQSAAAVLGSSDVVRADEGTFLAMIDSLVQDGDLRFEEVDASRLKAAGHSGRGHVILQRTERGIFYSKPILYPLVAAPFVAVLGQSGIALFHVGLLLGAVVVVLWVLGPDSRNRWALFGLLGASPVLVYLDWQMTEILQVALSLGGLALGLAGLRGRERSSVVLALGGVLLGLLISLRISNGVIAVIPVLAALLARRWRRAFLVGVAVAATWLVTVGATTVLSGATNPYRAQRTSFTPETGYPVGENAQEASSRFVEHLATHWTGALPASKRERVLYSSLYFFVGRHTGVLIYFPALWVFLGAAIRSRDRTGLAVLVGVGLAAVFFVGWMPGNWFGGESFFGNRYILSAWAALLFLPKRLPRPGAWAAAWLLALVVAVSSLMGVGVPDGKGSVGQRHTLAGVFRHLPYESTAQGIEGRRDRYWAGHFLRFVDPFAEVRKWSFRLSTDAAAPAEVLQAQWRVPGELELEISGAGPGTALVVDPGRHEQRIELRGDGGEERVRFRPRDPWRRHTFWWGADTSYYVRLIRLRLEGPPGEMAELRWLGDPAAREESFDLEVTRLDVGDAGATVPLEISVRNTSRRIWEDEDVTPVRLRWWWEGSERDVAPGISLPHAVRPGEEVTWSFDVDVPDRDQISRDEALLHLDLVLERIAWFQDRRGRTVADVEVRLPDEEAADGSERGEGR